MSWRDLLRPASFRGVTFHVEVGSISGGRRVALHEFPKRNLPYAEDLGRQAGRHEVVGYLIGPDYLQDRDLLVEALQVEGSGLLVHPSLGEFDVICGGFRAVERRQRGGFVEIDMQFVEAGSREPFSVLTSTQGGVTARADDASAAATNSMSADLKAGPLSAEVWI